MTIWQWQSTQLWKESLLLSITCLFHPAYLRSVIISYCQQCYESSHLTYTTEEKTCATRPLFSIFECNSHCCCYQLPSFPSSPPSLHNHQYHQLWNIFQEHSLTQLRQSTWLSIDKYSHHWQKGQIQIQIQIISSLTKGESEFNWQMKNPTGYRGWGTVKITITTVQDIS